MAPTSQSERPANRLPIFATLLLTLIFAPAAELSATEIEINYSHRLIPNIDPPESGYPEGGIYASFLADEEVWPAIPDPDLEQIHTRNYRYLFVWNETEAKTVDFVDAASETITVTAWPEPVYPFEPAVHGVPVINVSCDSTSLWDPETGIYVWGNYNNCFQTGVEWERPAHWDFYADDGSLVFSEPIGLRINGGWSRNLDQKALRFYFDDYGTTNQIDYDFFGGEPSSFRRLIIRTCRYNMLALNANIGEGLFLDFGHLGSRYTPVMVYLNEEYWGTYSLRERLDSQFIEHTHDLADDDYVFLKDGDQVHGDPAVFYDFLAGFSEPLDFTAHAWFASVQRDLDLLSYIDWLLINIHGGTADNGFDDNSAQLRIGDGQWQWVIWDEDDLYRSENQQANLFRFLAAANEAEWYEFQPPAAYFGPWTPEIQQWATMFNSLMHNSEFKALFFDRLAELLDGEFSLTAMSDRIDGLTAKQGPLMQLHYQRWGGSSQFGYYNHATTIKNWLTNRLPILLAQRADFRDHFRVPVELSRFTATPTDEQAELTWRTEAETGNRGFVITRSVGSPDAMAVIATYLDHAELIGRLDSETPVEYAFTDSFPTTNQVNHYQLHHVDLADETTAHNWIETASFTLPPSLYINEFLASNDGVNQDEAGEFDDWLEIYNAGPGEAQLGGLYLTDNFSNPTQWVFPDTTLGEGDFLLVWCDEDPLQGPLHSNFKLSASGEEIGLFQTMEDGNGLLDSHIFGPQATDLSEAREVDGGQIWASLATPTPGLSNNGLSLLPPAPPVSASIQMAPNYPNPFNPATTLTFVLPRSGQVNLSIHDLRGRRVALLVAEEREAGTHQVTWAGNNDAGQAVASGAYLARLEVAGEIRLSRLMLVK